MGGTASPLILCMACDPVIEAAAAATGDGCPAYVDDLAALLTTAEQALRSAILPPWASHVAGLCVDVHACQGLVLPMSPENLRRACASLPVQIKRHSSGATVVIGLTPELTKKILAHELGPSGARNAWIWQGECTCTFKTALVPAANHDWWRRTMAPSPFGASCV
eukprot:938779-Pyramimonas_sp.AAC.1